MKKCIAWLLAVCLITALAGCSGSGNALVARFQTVCSADEALALALSTDTVVMEKNGCTAGKAVWDAFYQATQRGEPASVLCAQYYVLDPAHMSAEAYAAEKDQYPQLFFSLVEYDGKQYAVKARQSTEETLDMQDTYAHLLHFTGTESYGGVQDAYDNYVLVDDPSATWEGIVAGMFSSQFGAGYKHYTVYKDHPDRHDN